MLCLSLSSLILPEALILTLVLAGILGCRIPVDPELLVSDFRFSPEAFDSFTGTTSLRYTLKRPATTTIRIIAPGKSGPGSVVMTLFEELKESSGIHQHTWLGDTEEGYFAPAGEYLGELEVEGESYQAVVRVYHR
jgi:hypothetical protein